jgi:hypothetical protein
MQIGINLLAGVGPDRSVSPVGQGTSNRYGKDRCDRKQTLALSHLAKKQVV